MESRPFLARSQALAVLLSLYSCSLLVRLALSSASTSRVCFTTGVPVGTLRCNPGLSCSADRTEDVIFQSHLEFAKAIRARPTPSQVASSCPKVDSKVCRSRGLSRLLGGPLKHSRRSTSFRLAAALSEEDDWGSYWEAPRTLRELFLKFTGADHQHLEPQDGYRQPRTAAIRYVSSSSCTCMAHEHVQAISHEQSLPFAIEVGIRTIGYNI